MRRFIEQKRLNDESSHGAVDMALPGYRIIRKLRQGGMATVYLAVQNSVGRKVALKIMAPGFGHDPEFADRFYREARIVGQLSHPNIVAIHDVGRYRHYNFIAMDYLAGGTLAERLQQSPTPGVAEALRITRELALALDYAHRRGIVHRDIKPDNVLFRSDGSAVLCDFGIARVVRRQVNVTQAGNVLGTPQYMSPEQAQGKTVDGRSDLYALGVVLVELLTGKPPYHSDDSVAVAVQHLSAPLPKLPRQLRLLQPVVNRLLAKKPAARFANARELISELERTEALLGRRAPDALTTTTPGAVHLLSLLQALLSTTWMVLNLRLSALVERLRRRSPEQPPGMSETDRRELDAWLMSEPAPSHATTVERAPLEPRPPGAWRGKIVASVLLFSAAAGLTQDQWGGPASPASKPSAALAAIVIPTPPPLASDTGPDTVEPDEHAGENAYPQLTIVSDPPRARVRILNIKPRYRAGMALPPGPYHLEVSAPRHVTEVFWLTLEDHDVRRHVSLARSRAGLPAGTLLRDPLRDGGHAPPMRVLPGTALRLADGRTLKPETAIAMSQTEIRFDDYARFVNATARELPDDAGWGRGTRPAINVSHQQAHDYAAWLSEQTGHHYRLPSRIEWEYAARAGSTHWDSAALRERANCRGGCASRYTGWLRSRTAPVADYPANAFGLHDLAGNVAEWLQGCAVGDAADCEKRTVAGGSHRDDTEYLAPDRFRYRAGTAKDDTGIRLVLELTAKPVGEARLHSAEAPAD